MKIYRYMKSLRLENVFFTQLILRLAAAVLSIGAAFYFVSIYAATCVGIFSVYGFYHHFFCYKDLYQLRSEYKHSDLSPEEALEKYQTEMCMIHFENSQNRVWWRIALCASLLPFLFPQIWFLSCLVTIFLFWYEYKNSEFTKEVYKQ